MGTAHKNTWTLIEELGMPVVEKHLMKRTDGRSLLEELVELKSDSRWLEYTRRRTLLRSGQQDVSDVLRLTAFERDIEDIRKQITCSDLPHWDITLFIRKRIECGDFILAGFCPPFSPNGPRQIVRPALLSTFPIDFLNSEIKADGLLLKGLTIYNSSRVFADLIGVRKSASNDNEKMAHLNHSITNALKAQLGRKPKLPPIKLLMIRRARTGHLLLPLSLEAKALAKASRDGSFGISKTVSHRTISNHCSHLYHWLKRRYKYTELPHKKS